MQEDEVLKIAIAETSMIVRSGLALVLKRIQGLKILPIELVSEESLDECVRFHKPEILIVNPVSCNTLIVPILFQPFPASFFAVNDPAGLRLHSTSDILRATFPDKTG